MRERLTALIIASTLFFGGCAGERHARRPDSSMHSATEADTREGVLQHYDRLFAQLRQLERLQRRKQPSIAHTYRSVRGVRPAFADCRQLFLRDDTVHDRAYYRLEHEMLDALSAQLLQFHQFLTDLPG